MNLSKCDLKVASLEELEVESYCMAFDRHKKALEVYACGSKAANAFFDSTDTTNAFALHFQGLYIYTFTQINPNLCYGSVT